MLEAGLCGLAGEDGGAPVRQDSRDGSGSPAVLGRDARRHAGGPGRDQPPDRAGDRGPVRAGLLVGGAGHDQLRHLHRHREPQSPDRAARQGQAEALRPAAGRAGPGRHPGRRDPADLARLPRRPAGRHPVPRHDQGAARPVRGDHGGLRAAARGHDRGLRRRPEQRGQLRVPGRDRAALHRVGPGQRLPGPDRPARLGPLGGGPGALRRPDRLRHPTRRLRRRAAGDPHPLPGAARKPGPRVRRHHPGQGRQETGRAGRHPGPRQDPPAAREGGSRDRQDHRQAVGTPGHHLAAIRRASPKTCA